MEVICSGPLQIRISWILMSKNQPTVLNHLHDYQKFRRRKFRRRKFRRLKFRCRWLRSTNRHIFSNLLEIVLSLSLNIYR